MKFNSHQQQFLNAHNKNRLDSQHNSHLNTIEHSSNNYSQKTPTKITSGLAAFANREDKDSKKQNYISDGKNNAYRIEEKIDINQNRGTYATNIAENNHDKSSFIQNSQMLSIMTSVIGKFDSRIRLIEENQNKIAGSLSRFLDKMNSLLFKGITNQYYNFQDIENNVNPKKGNNDLDQVALQKDLFPHFTEDLMKQIHAIIDTKQQIDIIQSNQLQDIDDQQLKIDLNQDFNKNNDSKSNNYISFKDQHNFALSAQVTQSLQDFPFKQIIQDSNKSNSHNRSFSTDKREDIEDISSDGFNKRNFLAEYKSSSQALCSNKTPSGKSNLQTETFAQDGFQQLTNKQMFASPSGNLSSTHSQASFLQHNLATTRPQTSNLNNQNNKFNNNNNNNQKQNSNHKTLQSKTSRVKQEVNPNPMSRDRNLDKSTNRGGTNNNNNASTKNQQEVSNNRQKSTKRPAQLQQQNEQQNQNSKTFKKSIQDVKQETKISQTPQTRVMQKTSRQQNQIQPSSMTKSQLITNQIQRNRSPGDKTDTYSTLVNSRQQLLFPLTENHKDHSYNQTNKVSIKNSQHASIKHSKTQTLNTIEQQDNEIIKPNNYLMTQSKNVVKDYSQDLYQSQKAKRTNFKDLKGDILDCIQEFTGEEFPQFAFTNKQILMNYLEYQDENLLLQQQMIEEQIDEILQENGNLVGGAIHSNGLRKKQQFQISDDLFEKQEILVDQSSWDRLVRDIASNRLTAKEVTVLRIYFTFMNHKNSTPEETDNQTFLRQVQSLVRKNLQTLDKLCKPEQLFKFSEEIKYRAMDLMMKVDLNELIKAKFSPLIEAMLFIVVEAIQHLDNVISAQEEDPDNNNNDQTELNTLEFIKESFQEKLQIVKDLLKIIQHY